MTETKQEKFRRLVEQRIKPIQRYSKMIDTMISQPVYEISSHDAQIVIDELTNIINPVIEKLEKARDGELRAKEIKEYQGVDWDKELEEGKED